ncbi:MAG: class I SAM-dependent methyltransferase [Candidatus Schekmanbacteria bacterium]|nr:MAG: class I SAM-dependent methyltransferase [Candidatus Schekmanbacteria bacterium]
MKEEELSFANRLKVNFIKPYLRKEDRIIDLGCGSMWLTKYLRSQGFNCTAFDSTPPADIVGDIKHYPFKESSYDTAIAFEMIEHVDCIDEIKHILKPGGLLLVTTPVPHFDFVCKILECLSISQKRTSPHSNLLYLEDIPMKLVEKKVLFGLCQCGALRNEEKV